MISNIPCKPIKKALQKVKTLDKNRYSKEITNKPTSRILNHIDKAIWVSVAKDISYWEPWKPEEY